MKSKLKRLTSDSLVYGLSNTVSKFLGVFLIPIYTRIFAPSDYGIIDLTQLSIVIMVILLTCGFDSAIFRFSYETEDKEEQKTIISTILLSVFIMGISISLFGLFFAKNISYILFNSSEYYLVIAVGLFQIPVTLITGFIYRVLRLRFKAKWYAGISIFGLLVTITLTIYLVVILRIGVIGVFIAKIIGDFLQTIIGFIVSYNNYTLKVDFNRLKDFFSFGLPLVPAGLSQWSLQYVNRYILLFFTNLTSVGIYAVGYKISSVMMILTAAFQLAWSPFAFSILKEPDAKETYAKVFKYFLILTTAVAAFMTTYATEIILIVATPDYKEASVLIGLLTLCILTIGSYYILCIGSTIEKKTLNITKSLLTGTIINIIAGVTLIPVVGIVGCAIAMFLGYLSACIIVYRSSQKCYPIPFEIKASVIIGISYFILYIISIIYSDILNPIKILTSALFYIIVFFFVLNKFERQKILDSIYKRLPGNKKDSI